MRRVLLAAVAAAACGAWAADGEPVPWVTVTPEVMPAGSVVPLVTFDVKLPAAVPAGSTVEVEFPYLCGVPQTTDAGADNYFSAQNPGGTALELSVGDDKPRNYVLRATFKSGPVAAGTRFKLFLKNEHIHPFSQKERAFATVIRAPAVTPGGERPIVARAQATVVHFPGGPAAKLRVVAPTCVTPGETFTVKVAALDANHNPPGAPWAGRLTLALEGGAGPAAAAMTPADKGYLAVDGFSVAAPGVYRVVVQSPLGAWRSNPVVCREAWERRIWWGDLHGHSAFSDGMGQPDEYFDYGRYVGLLDVTCLTDHAECMYGDTWPTAKVIANAKNDPPRFVTLASYEWTSDAWSGGYGHRCLYFAGDGGEYYLATVEGAKKPSELWAKYKLGEVVAAPHHTLAGMRWTEIDPAIERNVEIVSHWGSSEVEGGPYQPLTVWNGGAVVDALNAHYLFGFVGGGDNHNGAPGQNHGPSRFPHMYYTGGITALEMKENSRPAVFDALYNRRVYATSGNRDFIDFTLNGQPMAAMVPVAGPPAVEAEVATEDNIKSLEIMRNGVAAYADAAAAGRDYARVSWRDDAYDGQPGYYYLRVMSEDGHLSYSSPIWVSPGRWANGGPAKVRSLKGGATLALALPAAPAAGDCYAVRLVPTNAPAGSFAVMAGGETLATADVEAGAAAVLIPFKAAPGAKGVKLLYKGGDRADVADVVVFPYPWLEHKPLGRSWAFESENAGKQMRGAVVDDAAASQGKAIRVAPADMLYDKPVLWGPYSTLEPGTYKAHFYLRADGVSSNKLVAEIEVAAAPAGTGEVPRPKATKVLSAAAVAAGGVYHDFPLEFTLTETSAVEFKVKYVGSAVLYIDKVVAEQIETE